MTVVVTGMGVWTAAGRGADAVVQALVSREPAFVPDPPYGADGLRTARCAIVQGVARDNPALHLLKAVVSQALGSRDGAGVGLIVGTSSGDICGPWQAWHKAVLDGQSPSGAEPSRDGPTSAVADDLGLTGPCTTVSVACASGTAAFSVALGWLQDELCDAVVVAGVDGLSTFVHAGFGGLGALASDRARPFTAGRDGLTLGEGAAALLLERLRPGVVPLATVLGAGMACDAKHITAPHPEGRGCADSMRAALLDAGRSADDVHMVSLHGTGTRFNDQMEAKAAAALWPDGVGLHGVKHVIGHTLGAAGAIEAAVVVQCLLRGEQPPPPQNVDPGLGLPATPNPAVPRVALSTSSAFGGVNAAVVLGVVGESSAPAPPPVSLRTVAGPLVQLDGGTVDFRARWPQAPDRFFRSDRYVRLGVLAVAELLAGETVPHHTGICLSTRTGCRGVDQRYHKRLLELGAAFASRRDFTWTVPGGPAAEAAMIWGLRGPTLVLVDPADTALPEAERLVRWARAEAMIALTVELPSLTGPGWAQAWRVEVVR